MPFDRFKTRRFRDIWAETLRGIAAGCAVCLLTAPLLAEGTAAPVSKYIEQLASRDVGVRREAAYQLSNLGPAARPAIPALLKALDDDDKQVWTSVIATFAAMGPVAEESIPALLERIDGRKGKGHRERDQNWGLWRTAYALSRMGTPAIPPLIQALGENDLGLHLAAARALGEMGPAAHDAIPALIKNLADNQESVRNETAQALAAIGPAAGSALVNALPDADAHRRAAAAAALAQMDPPYRDGAAQVEDAASKESDPVVRIALIAALPRTGVPPDHCVAILLPSLTDDHDDLRHAALNALLSSPAVRLAAVPKLAPLLKDPKPAVRERAVHALGRIGPGAVDALPAVVDAARAADGAPAYGQALAEIGPKALPVLLGVLQKGKPEEGKWVMRVLHNFGPPAVPVLAEALKNPDPEMRSAAAAALGEMGRDGAAASSALFALTKDSVPSVQAAGLRALVAVHADTGRLKPLLEAGLKNSHPGVRKAAAAGLASLGDTAALGVNGLVDLLDDENPAGRLAAVQALGQLGPKAEPAVQPLLAHLDDPVLQGAALETLGLIGPASEPAVPRLIELAKNSELRPAVMVVFSKIGRGAGAALPSIYRAVNDSAPEVRAPAIAALASVENDDAKALNAIIPLADRNQTGTVRRAAAHALGKYGPAAAPAVPRLIALLDRENERGEAMRALKSIGVHSVPDLVTMLAVHDSRVRTFACESLGTLGPDAKDAAPKLREVAEEDSAVRESAKAALKKIEPPAP
jgi:HEAT repeat protein